ncbi:MAG: D-alanyl-D-alanine carboxypeptidase/D-alanyl-D-alanine-endopeptidase [Phycisphaerales bacterium]|nr:D-alanyl-D-alanine carboxypeptidase/D-alanyl-D-alanine-endopeptidase [Phycisphaerales bacterium]
MHAVADVGLNRLGGGRRGGIRAGLAGVLVAAAMGLIGPDYSGLTSAVFAQTRATASRADDARGPLGREIAKQVDDNKMGKASVGISIVDVDTGEVIAEYRERQKLTPASNLKILTSGTAAVMLGADYKFTTTFNIDGDKLVVVGSGDPAFADPELLKDKNIPLEQFLDSLIQPIVDAQVKGLRQVVVDDRAFDRDMVHPTWPKDQLSRWYCAPVSGFNFYTNIIELWPRPAGVGEPATYRRVPDASWLEIINRTKTVGNKGTTAIGLDRDGDNNKFVLSGTILAAPQEPVSCTVSNPPAIFARLLADRLQKHPELLAIDEATGAPVRLTSRVASNDEKFDLSQPPIVAVQTPIFAVLRRCNVDSYNLYAEALIKTLGRSTGQAGSWGNGAAVIRMAVKDLVGPDAGDLVIVDGSGMSAENAVSPSLLSRWLAAIARNKDVGAMFIDSLPQPGEGTLTKRFAKRPPGIIHAKSGFIRGVQCLSGYIINPDNNRRLAFSVMANRLELAQGSAKQLHEDVVRKAAEWLEKQPVRSVREKLGG